MRCSYCKKEEKGHEFSPKHIRIRKDKKILYFCKPKHYKLYNKKQLNNYYSKDIMLEQDIKKQELENNIMFKILNYLRNKKEVKK